MKSRLFLTAAAAGLVCAQALAALPPAKAAAPAGPWAKVPELPTACYKSQDTWWDKNNAAIDAVQADQEQQNEINGAIGQKLTDAWSQNPMAVMQALQQAMLNDPQNPRAAGGRRSSIPQSTTCSAACRKRH